MTTAPFLCVACGTDNHPGRRACRTCGIPLGPTTCPACSHRHDPADRFCAGCGAPLPGSYVPGRLSASHDRPAAG